MNLKNNKKFDNLEPVIQKALDYYVKDILKVCGDNILKIVLFGSVARGDDTKDSDIDVFLLLKENNLLDESFTKSANRADKACDYETYIAPFTLSEDEYLEHKRLGMPVTKDIDREGIVLYDAER